MTPTPTQRKVIATICELLQITDEEMFSHSRKRARVLARQLYCKWLKINTKYSLSVIAHRFMGNYDHSSVIYSLNTIDDLIDTDSTIRHYWEVLAYIQEPIDRAPSFCSMRYKPQNQLSC